MFRNTSAFSGFSVGDIEAARHFYAGTLGLEVIDTNGMLRLRIAGGNPVLVYPKDDHQPATYTALNFPVNDIEVAVAELTRRGVTFDRSGDADAAGIHRGDGPPIAWFKDPAGNVLSVLQV